MAKQIILTQNNFGIPIELQFLSGSNAPIDLTDKIVEVAISYDGTIIDVLQATISSYTDGTAYIVTTTRHTSNVGLYTTYWSVKDEYGYITAQSDLYYYVKEEYNGDESNSIEQDKGTIEEEFDKVNSSIKSLDKANSGISARVSELETKVSKNQSSISTINNNIVDIINNVNSIKETISKNKEIYVSSLDELEAALNKISNGGVININSGNYTPTKTYKIPERTIIKGIGKVIFDCSSTLLNCVFTNKLTGQESGYNGSSNIVINNIIFDGKGTVHTITPVGFGHSKNIIVERCGFKGFNRWHNIELNGCSNCYIIFNEFEDYGTVSRDNATEVIQIDYMGSSEQYPWTSKYDNTACSNITIESNSFKNIKTTTGCIGCHSYKKGVIPSNIIIKNNLLENVEKFYYLLGSKNSVIEGNKGTGLGTFVVIGNGAGNNMDGIIINNNNCTAGGFEGDHRFVLGVDTDKHSYNVIITNNIAKDFNRHCIGGTFSDGVCSNNIIQGCGRHGIYMYGWFNFTVMGNRIYQFSKEVSGYNGIKYGDNANIPTKNCIIIGNFAESVTAGTNQTNNVVANNL